jgi:hypothetical protein
MTGAVMRGGISQETLDQHPDSPIWGRWAKGAKHRIYQELPESLHEYVEQALIPYWVIDNTWKTICEETERIRDFFLKFMEWKNQQSSQESQ